MKSRKNIPDWDQRPILVAVTGPNGAGKSTFYEAHLKRSGLRLLNADLFAREMGIDSYAAADIVARLRRELVEQQESFVFETVFSDPAGEKLAFLQEAVKAGYTVVLCFIGVANHDISEERVAMRVTQGGHDVPTDKLVARFPRVLLNLKAAIPKLPHVLVFDNNDLRTQYRQIAVFKNGKPVFLAKSIPAWFKGVG